MPATDECDQYSTSDTWLPLWYQLVAHVAEWIAIGAPQYIIALIKFGAYVPLLATPTPFFIASPPLVAEKLQSWLKLRDHYLFTGAIKQLSAAPKFCCSAFLVPKKDGGHRLVVDLRPINKYFPTMATTYETLSWLKHVPRGIVFGASLDLQDGYHHVRLHPLLR